MKEFSIRSKRGRNVTFRANSARDGSFRATRTSIRDVISKSVDAGKMGYLWIFNLNSQSNEYVDKTTVSAELHEGVLRLGCHVFSKAASKKILKWAGVK